MRKSQFVCVASAAVLLLISIHAEAARNDVVDTATLKKTLEKRFPTLTIVDVQPAPIPALYEVFTGKSIVYTDQTGNYLLSGSLTDTRTQNNLTEARINERNAIRFESLPFDQAIKVVKGSGARRLAVFTDPDCPFCRKLEEELRSIEDLTMYLFLFPLTQIHPQAERRAKLIWCSPDRAQAWTQWMLENKEPDAAPCSGDPVKSTLELGERLNVAGTPTMYFEDGSRTAGSLPAAELTRRLDEASKRSL